MKMCSSKVCHFGLGSSNDHPEDCVFEREDPVPETPEKKKRNYTSVRLKSYTLLYGSLQDLVEDITPNCGHKGIHLNMTGTDCH